jgi:N-acetyl-anhydromuramyl-L-alanine amidase AmpD
METKSLAHFRAAGIALASVFLLMGAVSAFLQAGGARLSISNRLSPLNRKRPIRPETRYIILHTTEGAEEGSLHKVQRYGETHYFVTLSGNVYRIIDRNRIATHTGRSIWEGKSNLETCSIVI